MTAACLVVGVGGFVVGKMSGGASPGGEADELIGRAKQVASERSGGSREGGATRRDSSGRPIRTSSDRSAGTIAERLSKMEDIVRGENALDRSRSLLAWIDSLAPDEFQSAVDRFRSLGLTEARMGEYAMLLTAWAEIDPTAALAYTTENTGGSMATSTVLAAWAGRDPESAIAWAKANHEGDEANPYMVGIIRSLAENDPTRATQLLEELPYSGERGEALAAMMSHVLKLGPEAAKGWVASLSDERLRDGATGRFAEEMAKNDPAGAAAWLLANLGESSTTKVDEVFAEWAKADKGAAMSSFQNLPAGDARSRALRGLITVEARNDPQAAANLLNSNPADVDDRMVMHFVWNSFGKAPDVAANQIGLIADAEMQNRMYSRTLDSWLDRDQAAAQRWINSANLPEPVLKSLARRKTP